MFPVVAKVVNKYPAPEYEPALGKLKSDKCAADPLTVCTSIRCENVDIYISN